MGIITILSLTKNFFYFVVGTVVTCVLVALKVFSSMRGDSSLYMTLMPSGNLTLNIITTTEVTAICITIIISVITNTTNVITPITTIITTSTATVTTNTAKVTTTTTYYNY